MTPRIKAGLLIALAVLMTGGAGFVLGVLSHQVWQKQNGTPESMRRAVWRQIDKLEPDAEQRQRLEAVIEPAIQELFALRREVDGRGWGIMDRATDAVARELTPKQAEYWQKLKPRRPVRRP
jgi:hypothetical protein